MSPEVRLTPEGRVEAVDTGELAPEEFEELAHLVDTLEANEQIAHEPGPLTGGQTHQVETDDRGRLVLKRKRFSAI